MPDSLNEQITKYLTDIHSIEAQALVQMAAAPRIAGDEQIAGSFSRHHAETEDHERRVRELLEKRGESPSKLKDLAGRAGGAGMVLFAKFNPDTPGKLVAHGFSYEHLEIAAYDLLTQAAERAGDNDALELARANGAQEHAMADRLAECFDRAVDASLRDKPQQSIEEALVGYLSDEHAIESQAISLLQGGEKIAGAPGLEKAFADHLAETRQHKLLVEARLAAHGASASRFKSAALRVGGLNLGGFFGGQPDTPAKLAGFAYAFENLETAAYELLKRVAERAGDEETVRIADRILTDERGAAVTVHQQFGPAMDVTLGKKGLTGARSS
jgi:ferritin-like metal-binding protein YciE